MEEKRAVEGVGMNNSDFINSSALQIRLETKELLSQIEFFLRIGFMRSCALKDTVSNWRYGLVRARDPTL